jgi:ribosome-associated protein
MKSTTFKIQGEYIELLQLLKAIGYAQTGGHAKQLVEEGIVMRNGQMELRKRAKLYPGDTVLLHDEVTIRLV